MVVDVVVAKVKGSFTNCLNLTNIDFFVLLSNFTAYTYAYFYFFFGSGRCLNAATCIFYALSQPT